MARARAARRRAGVMRKDAANAAPQRNWAFFLDIDGTLLEIEETPDAVEHRSRARSACRIWPVAGGAVALISGRSLARIDEPVPPLVLPAAGQHGAERRDAQGGATATAFRQRAAPVARRHPQVRGAAPGLVFEDKGASVALHYRLAPQLAPPRTKRCARPPSRSASRSRCRTARWWSSSSPRAATRARRSPSSCGSRRSPGACRCSSATT